MRMILSGLKIFMDELSPSRQNFFYSQLNKSSLISKKTQTTEGFGQNDRRL